VAPSTSAAPVVASTSAASVTPVLVTGPCCHFGVASHTAGD
jgi:hypothetical protein